MLNYVARFCHLEHLRAKYGFHWRTLLHHLKSLNYISCAAGCVIKTPCEKCMFSLARLVLLLCVFMDVLGHHSFFLYQIAAPAFSFHAFVTWCVTFEC